MLWKQEYAKPLTVRMFYKRREVHSYYNPCIKTQCMQMCFEFRKKIDRFIENTFVYIY